MDRSMKHSDKRLNGKTIAQEEEDLIVRWYYPHEMEFVFHQNVLMSIAKKAFVLAIF